MRRKWWNWNDLHETLDRYRHTSEDLEIKQEFSWFTAIYPSYIVSINLFF